MEPHWARRKHHRLGNLIPFCYHVRHNVDLDKVTGNQRKIEILIIWNNRKKEKMKRIFIFTMILMALIACTVAVRAIIGYFSVTQATSDSTATNIPQAGIPNPASVYCEQQGNKHEIQMASDGSQPGICTFPDGSTCEEWAYYRGECGPAAQASPTPAMTVEATTEASGGGPGGSTNSGGNASGGYMPPGTSEEIADWWGVIKSTEPGA
jgi:putative hemolysin